MIEENYRIKMVQFETVRKQIEELREDYLENYFPSIENFAAAHGVTEESALVIICWGKESISARYLK